MHRSLVLLLAAALTRPALAAKTVTVDQMEQFLATLKSKSDASAANKIITMQLTQRVNSARLTRWEMKFPGSRTRQALLVLADQSAFLELPAADVPSKPAPDFATQKQILQQAVDKATNALKALPNFYADRETQHFEDTMPHSGMEGESGANLSNRRMGMPVPLSTETDYLPLHATGKSSEAITYRDGSDVTDTSGKKPKTGARDLTTSGEFGPIIAVVLNGALHGEVSFSHWEQGSNGALAIYSYSVSKENSHFTVELPNVEKGQPIEPAYHGEIAVDPANGDIYRITEIADFDSNSDGVECAIAVEYAPVEIGARIYVCPARSVALSRVPGYVDYSPRSGERVPMQTFLNDVTFTQYHLFRSESRIVPE